jgi:very-short-patch-repair endonuclease
VKKPVNSQGFFTGPIRLLNGWEVSGERATPQCIADAQEGRIATWQLRALGVSEDRIRSETRRGFLRRCRRGVYAIGSPRDTAHTREVEVLLALGPSAVLSDLSVLAHHGLIPPAAEVHVVAPRSKSRPGIRVHRYSSLGPNQIKTVDGLAMTTVERAIADAAHHFRSREALAQIVHEAVFRKLTSRTKLRATANSRIITILDGPSQRTESRHQKLALKLLMSANLPEEPETEAELWGFRADIFFRDARVVVEVDPFETHGQIESNFERDKRKDQTFRQHGIETVRVSATQLKKHPYAFVADVAATVARRLVRAA